MAFAPDIRLRLLNEKPADDTGQYVVYWMTSARRLGWNFGLEHAAARARERGRPLIFLEALRCGYPYASPRLHSFILQGMAANQRRLAGSPVSYYPYVETAHGQGKGLLETLARRACLVITDDSPAFFLPRMLMAAGRKLAVRLEAVDSNGLLPLAAVEKPYPSAYTFRRFLQKNLPDYLDQMPEADPLAGCGLPRLGELPGSITERWPIPPPELLAAEPTAIAKLHLGHDTAPLALRGGEEQAVEALHRFVDERLTIYDTRRNQPSEEATSGLSPYLHMGHISAHQVFCEIAAAEDWAPHRLNPETKGQRSGWWGMGDSAEAFLDQLITWRELGYTFCRLRPDYMQYESLPDWARATLEAHAADPRPYVYGLDQLEQADTHDPIWNAAQRQLLREGTIHNYLRMLWGKKILEWSAGPRQALETMIYLNDKYALDGRDPNSYSGIFWCLGRFDRPFGPERPIFGKVRYMSSANTKRKLRLANYLESYGD